MTFEQPLAQPPGFSGDRAVMAFEGGTLTAFDLLTGKPAWTVERTATAAPVVSADRAYVLNGRALTALALADGQPAWTIELGEAPATGLTAIGGWLLAIGASGQVTAYRASDGSQVWSVEAGAPVRQPASVEGQHVFIAREDGTIVALSIENGRTVWTRRIGGSPQPLLALGDRLYDEIAGALAEAVPEEGRRKTVLHSLRHTVGSTLKGEGIVAEKRADLLGHKGRTATEETYASQSTLESLRELIHRLPVATAHLAPSPIRLVPWVERKEPAPWGRPARGGKAKTTD